MDEVVERVAPQTVVIRVDLNGYEGKRGDEKVLDRYGPKIQKLGVKM